MNCVLCPVSLPCSPSDKHLSHSKVTSCQWLDHPRNFTLVSSFCLAYSIRFYSSCKQYSGKGERAVQILPEKRIFQCLLNKAWKTCASHALPFERLRRMSEVELWCYPQNKALLKLPLSAVLNNVQFTLHSFIHKQMYACWMTLKSPDHSCSTCFITKVSTMRGYYEESTEFWPKQTN